MIYRLAMGPKGAQVVSGLPGSELGQPKNMFITDRSYGSQERAVAALLSLKIRMGAKLTQAELYQVSAELEDGAHGTGA